MQGTAASDSIDFEQLLNDSNQSIDDIALQLSNLLKVNKLTMSIAESVSGGMLSSYCIKHGGASQFFLGGVVAYDALLKVKLCRVHTKTVSKYGVVSSFVTEEMARGIQAITGSDISIATTGVAGPANDQYAEDQTGKVFVSWYLHNHFQKTKQVGW